MNNEKIDKIIPTDELDNVLPKYEPVKLSGKNLAQQYVSAFNTGMNIYQCVNYLQGSIDATINGVNNVVKSWNDSVDETLTKSIEITKETTTEQFNTEWTNKQPELIEQVNTLTTNQFNEDWGVLENRINTTLETQNTNIQNIQTQQTNLANEQTNLSNQQTTLSNRMDTFTSLSEGSTTGDAELKDIRVGANGITYNNAGDSVRGQYSQLKEDLVNGYVGTNSLVLQKIEGVTGTMQYLDRVLYDKKIGNDETGTYNIVNSVGDTILLFKKGLGFINSTKQILLIVDADLKKLRDIQGSTVFNLQTLLDNQYLVIDGNSLKYLDFDFMNDGKIPYIDKNVNVIPKTNFGTNSYSEGINTYGTGVPCFAPFRYNGNIHVKNMSNYALYDLDGTFISSANIGTNTVNIEDKIVVFFSTDIDNATIEFDKAEESVNQYSGKQCSVFGDSLTADAPYYPYLAKMTGLNIKNCGIGGTRVSGTDDTAFWQDMRINLLEGDFILIMGGTNDAPYAQIGDINLDNKDTNTFVGAYNVMLSKIYYRYNLTEGYYTDIDYSGVNKLDDKTIFPNIIIITNTARFDSKANYDKTKEFAKACEQIAEMWNIPCVDSFNNMAMNWCSYKAYFGDTDFVHYRQRGRAKLGCLIANKFNELYANFDDQVN